MRAVVEHRAASGSVESDLSEAAFSARLLNVGAVHHDIVALIIDDIADINNLIFAWTR